MFVALAALVLAAVSQIVHATPTTSPTKPTKLDVTIAAGFPIRTLDIIRNGTTGTHDGTTGTHDGTIRVRGTTGTHDGTIHGRTAAANPATLLLCPNTNCASCSGFALSSFPLDECFLTNVEALSVAISQPAGGGLPFAVTVGTPECATLAQIPTVNECFNVNGGPFTNFALLE
ncbi:hypothetical protein V8D89_001970 [Ganoderma adspersum]